jgi:osmotically-inducible protein OsmY
VDGVEPQQEERHLQSERGVSMQDERRDDEQIERDVLVQLRWAVGARCEHLRVTVRDGNVALAGWLASPAKRCEAAEAARWVRGVERVVNNIVVPVMAPPG